MSLRKKFAALQKDERGASSIEYCFTLVLVFLAVVSAWGALGDSLRDLYGDHGKAMQDARQNSKST